MKTVLKTTLLTLFASASITHAAIIAETSFGGSAASPTGDTGFSSTIWASSSGGGTASSADFISGDMANLPDAYTNSGFVNSGNHIETASSPAFRTLSSAIDVETADTRYFSFLYRQNNATTGENGGFSFYSGGNERSQVGMGLNNSIRIVDVGGSNKATTDDNIWVTGTDTAWIVGKLVTAVGNDTLSIRVFTGTDAIGAEDFSGPKSTSLGFAINGNLDNIRFNSSGGTNTQQFDEWRLGSTWDSVTVIPEPSTAALLGLAGLAMALLMRNRRR
ncbi:MAG: PEP-CTERM sorting domain-containing protein [Kiritimatiellia bacterium]